MVSTKTRTIALLSLILLISPVYPQTQEGMAVVVSSRNDVENRLVQTARRNFVKLLVEDERGYQLGAATGLAVSSHMVITCFHLTQKMSGKPLKRAKQLMSQRKPQLRVTYKGKDGVIVSTDPKRDILLLRFDNVEFEPLIELDESPYVGEKIGLISYAFQIDDNGLYQEAVVSGESGNVILVYPTTLPGASGAGVYNEKGQLVGMNDGFIFHMGSDEWSVSKGTFGVIVPAKILKPFIEQAQKLDPPKPQIVAEEVK